MHAWSALFLQGLLSWGPARASAEHAGPAGDRGQGLRATQRPDGPAPSELTPVLDGGLRPRARDHHDGQPFSPDPEAHKHRHHPRGWRHQGLPRVFVSYMLADECCSPNKPLENLDFFLTHGATRAANSAVTYRLTLNGHNPIAEDLVSQHNARVLADEGTHAAFVLLLHRENIGFDFGAHRDALAFEALHANCSKAGEGCPGDTSHLAPFRPGDPATSTKPPFEELPYDAVVFLNCGVRGPFYPTYVAEDWHWTDGFLRRLAWAPAYNGLVGASATGGAPATDRVALVGTSLACVRAADEIGGAGPRVEGMAFAMTREALLYALLHDPSPFAHHKGKHQAIVDGEYALSRVVLGAPGKKWNIGSLLVEHAGVDFRNESNWDCNGHLHPSRKGFYGPGMTVAPLEVLFIKGKWSSKTETDLFTQFMNRRVEHKAFVVYDPYTYKTPEPENYQRWPGAKKERWRKTTLKQGGWPYRQERPEGWESFTGDQRREWKKRNLKNGGK
jgi:hypothetical protein